MKRLARIGIMLAALSCGTGAAAQSFNQALAHYRAAKTDCARLFERRIAGPCDEACRAAAAARQAKCLASAEERYLAVLRRELRSRR